MVNWIDLKTNQQTQINNEICETLKITLVMKRKYFLIKHKNKKKNELNFFFFINKIKIKTYFEIYCLFTTPNFAYVAKIIILRLYRIILLFIPFVRFLGSFLQHKCEGNDIF